MDTTNCDHHLVLPCPGIMYNRKISSNGFRLEYNHDYLVKLIKLYNKEVDNENTWWGKTVDLEHEIHTAIGINKNQVELTSNMDSIVSCEYYFNGLLFYSDKPKPFTANGLLNGFKVLQNQLMRTIYREMDDVIDDNIDLNNILTAIFENVNDHPWVFIKGLVVKTTGEVIITDHMYNRESSTTFDKGNDMSKSSSVTVKQNTKRTITKEYGNTSDKKVDNKSTNSKASTGKKETVSSKATKKLNSKQDK